MEWNFAQDPAAVAAVVGLLAGPDLTVVPLDATVATAMDLTQIDALVAAAPPLGRMVAAWEETLRATGTGAAAVRVHLHDPAAVLVAAGEGHRVGARTRQLRLAVAADGRIVADPAARPAEVVVSLDGPAVARRTTELLAG